MSQFGIHNLYAHQSLNAHAQILKSDLSNESLNASDLKALLDKLYKDSLVQQAVDVPVRDAIAVWRTTNDKQLAVLDAELGIKDLMIKAGINARKYGKTLIIPVIVDAASNHRVPLTTQLSTLSNGHYRVLRLVEVSDFDTADSNESSVLSDYYGLPRWYYVNGSRLHPSRAFVIQANGAGNSFIESIYPYLCDFYQRNANTTQATSESNFLTFGTNLEMLQQLAEARAQASGNGDAGVIAQELLTERLRELRRNANNNNAWGYDKEHEKVEQVSKSNIGQMVDATEQAAKFLAAAADIPMSRFLGYRVSGLGAGDDSSNYAQTLDSLRVAMFGDAIKRLDSLLQFIYPEIKSTEYQWNPIPVFK